MKRLLIIVLLLVVGCASTPPPGSNLNFGFDRPPGWAWDHQEMKGRQDLLQAVSEDGKAKVFGMYFDMDPQGAEATKLLGEGLVPRVASVVAALEANLPARYNDFELVGDGAVEFSDALVGEIVFLGEDKRKNDGRRWRRLLVTLSPNEPDRLVLIGFGAPAEEHSRYQDDFEAFEKSWKWKKG